MRDLLLVIDLQKVYADGAPWACRETGRACAAVRRLLVSDPIEPWDAALGLPINQVDMAYTLHTFDGVVLDGLSRLGIDVPAESAEAWHACWLAIGQVLGVTESRACQLHTKAVLQLRAKMSDVSDVG